MNNHLDFIQYKNTRNKNFMPYQYNLYTGVWRGDHSVTAGSEMPNATHSVFTYKLRLVPVRPG